MRRAPFGQLLLIAFIVTATACGSADTPITPMVTAPTSTVFETFTGRLAPNGATSFPFSSSAGGSISVTLTSFTPDTTQQVGLWLGVWDSARARCTFGVANDKATGPNPAANPPKAA